MKSVKFLLFFILLTFAMNAQTVQQLIGEADKAATQEFNNKKAIEKLQAADKLQPRNWEILWRLSRSYVDLGEHTYGEAAQIDLFNKAFNYADQAVKLAGDKSICYLRRAIANGKIALFKGVFTVGDVVTRVKDDAEKAIALNNGGNEFQSVAHFVLARTHAKLAEKSSIVRWPLGLGWGDIKVALKEFDVAIRMRGDFRMYHYEYAKALIEDGNYAAAKGQLQQVNQLPIRDEDDYTVGADATKLLNEIKNK